MIRRTVGASAAALSALLLATGCASTGTGGGSLTGRHITAADIEQTGFTNVAEVLDANRMVSARGDGFVIGSRGRSNIPDRFARDTSGGFRVAPGTDMAEYAIVEVDGTRLGSEGVRSTLESLPASSVAEIRILSPSEALTHYGDAGSGLIVIRTKD